MDPKKKAPPAKAPAKGAKVDEAAAVPAAPPPDAPGWDTLSALLSGLKERARAYDEWRAGVKVYNTAAAAPAQEVAPKPSEDSDPMAEVEVVEAGPAGIKASSSMAYYESLLAGVEPERLNVPVLMHAMLEQVCGTKGTLGFSLPLPLPLRSLSLSLSLSPLGPPILRFPYHSDSKSALLSVFQVARSVGGEDVVAEGEQAAAETWALDALARAFAVFGDAADKGSVFAAGLHGADGDDSGGPYTLVQEVGGCDPVHQ